MLPSRLVNPTAPIRKLYRAMRPDPANAALPLCGPDARSLGARPGVDIAVDMNGVVHPSTGGMSVSPDDLRNLPPHRRPRSLGGEGKDPVFVVGTGDLGGPLTYRPDPRRPGAHGFVEPAAPMAMAAYQHALCETGPRWRIME